MHFKSSGVTNSAQPGGNYEGTCPNNSQQPYDATDVIEGLVNGTYPPVGGSVPFPYGCVALVGVTPQDVPETNQYGDYKLFYEEQVQYTSHCMDFYELNSWENYLKEIITDFNPYSPPTIVEPFGIDLVSTLIYNTNHYELSHIVGIWYGEELNGNHPPPTPWP